MANVQAMLDTHPRAVDVDAEVLAQTIDALVECANTCTQCADACLSEPDVAPQVACIRLNLDCADVCAATSRVVARQTDVDAEVVRRLLDACITACRSCADECARHAPHMAHCDICAQSCRRCEQACRDLVEAIS
jgi:hypothetical protein